MIDKEIQMEIDKFIEAEDKAKYTEAFQTILGEKKGHPSFTGPAAELWTKIFGLESQIKVDGKGEFSALCITSVESILQLAEQIIHAKGQQMSTQLPGTMPQDYDEPLPAETMQAYNDKTTEPSTTVQEDPQPSFVELSTPDKSASKMKRPDLIQEIENTHSVLPNLVRSPPNKGRWVYEDKQTLVEEVLRLRQETKRLLPQDLEPEEFVRKPSKKQEMQEARDRFCQTMDDLISHGNSSADTFNMITTLYNWVKNL